uniref:Uncharacterized protein n=1 Tax=viral metagenome TaxID=1070528 RepID=A0A6C0BML2_9ZZZZ
MISLSSFLHYWWPPTKVAFLYNNQIHIKPVLRAEGHGFIVPLYGQEHCVEDLLALDLIETS